MRERLATLLLRTLAAGMLALAAGTAAAACSSAPAAPPVPASFAVYDGGTCYVGYQYDPLEVQLYGGVPAGCTPVTFPSVSYVPSSGTLAFLLATHLAEYDAFYHSGYWYDTYYAPLAPRYHVSLSVTRTTFTSNSATFRSTYGRMIQTQSAKAAYVDSRGRRVSGSSYRFPASNSNARTGPVTNAGRTSSGGGTTTNTRPFSGSAYSRPLSNSRPAGRR